LASAWTHSVPVNSQAAFRWTQDRLTDFFLQDSTIGRGPQKPKSYRLIGMIVSFVK